MTKDEILRGESKNVEFKEMLPIRFAKHSACSKN